jgi:hypothetical protein
MLNLVASQAVDLTPGRRYALRGFYRSDAAVVASALSDRGDTEYLWSPAFPPTPEWQEFSWEFTLAKPARSFLVALRLGSMGTAYWDDVTLEEVSEE